MSRSVKHDGGFLALRFAVEMDAGDVSALVGLARRHDVRIVQESLMKIMKEIHMIIIRVV